MFAKTIPIAILVALVLGGIHGGLFTPTEAGAVGATGALILAVGKRKLSWSTLWRVLVETGQITAAILFLIIAAPTYSRMLTLSGIPNLFGNWIETADLGIYGLLAIYCAIVLLMGTILDSSSIMLIILPLTLPIVAGMGMDLVWFGIITIIAVEVGLLTPPLGIAAYVIKSTLEDDRISLADIFVGAFPFAIIMVGVLVLIIAFPGLSLFLIDL